MSDSQSSSGNEAAPDIVERLLAWPVAYGEVPWSSLYIGAVMKEAADHIDLLRRSNDQRGNDLVTVITQRDAAERGVAQQPPDPAIECWSIVEQLRANEGAEVILLCDNPDFNGQPNNAIEICDDWTQWTQRRFTGETMLDCLRAALRARTEDAAVISMEGK